MPRFVDLSHTVRDGLVTYPGLPSPTVRDHLSRAASERAYAPGTTFQIGAIEMIANTGTYVDAPFHRFAEGPDLAHLELERLADLEGVRVEAPSGPERRAIDADVFAGLELAGRAVLVQTGWDAHWGRPAYGEGHPYLTRAAADHLVAAGARFLAIDSLNVDDDSDGERPVHTTLLGAGIPIGEHLTGLAALPDTGFRFFAVPVKVEGMGSFPVRAFAIVP